MCFIWRANVKYVMSNIWCVIVTIKTVLKGNKNMRSNNRPMHIIIVLFSSIKLKPKIDLNKHKRCLCQWPNHRRPELRINDAWKKLKPGRLRINWQLKFKKPGVCEYRWRLRPWDWYYILQLVKNGKVFLNVLQCMHVLINKRLAVIIITRVPRWRTHFFL